MKKVIRITVILLIILAVLTGCGRIRPDLPAESETVNVQPTDKNESTDTSTKPTLTDEEKESDKKSAEKETPAETNNAEKEVAAATPKESKPAEQSETTEQTKAAEQPKSTEKSKSTEQTKTTEQAKPEKQTTPAEKPKTKEEPKPAEKPAETKTKTAYDYKFDIDVIKADCIAIGKSMGYKLDTSLSTQNATWWNPVIASENNQGDALKSNLNQYIQFHTLDNLSAYGMDEITSFNICCESRGGGSYAIYFVFA